MTSVNQLADFVHKAPQAAMQAASLIK